MKALAVPSKVIGSKGRGREERYLRHSLSYDGYCKICLCKKGVKHFTVIHRVVAKVFIYNHNKKMQVNHMNGIKTDNRVENLEWCTAKENIIHAYSTGLKKAKNGELSPNPKLKEVDVINIRKEYGALNMRKLAQKYNVSERNISHILKRNTWKHI